jgi:hypothetical protein
VRSIKVLYCSTLVNGIKCVHMAPNIFLVTAYCNRNYENRMTSSGILNEID